MVGGGKNGTDVCCTFPDLFWQNPQFSFTLSEVDGSSRDSKTCSFVLALMQKHQRRSGIKLSIALHVYQVHTHTHTRADVSPLQSARVSAGPSRADVPVT